MAYATIEQMIDRWGEVEMIRLTAPDGQVADVIDRNRVQIALDDASALIDGYARRRYATPLAPVPPEVLDCCCTLARYGLARGEQKSPSEQMREERKQWLAWLDRVSNGTVVLGNLPSATATGTSGARTQDRPRDFAAGPGLI